MIHFYQFPEAALSQIQISSLAISGELRDQTGSARVNAIGYFAQEIL